MATKPFSFRDLLALNPKLSFKDNLDGTYTMESTATISGDVIVDVEYDGVVGNPVPTNAALMGANDPANNLKPLNVDATGNLLTSSTLDSSGVIGDPVPLNGSYIAGRTQSNTLVASSMTDDGRMLSGGNSSVYIDKDGVTYEIKESYFYPNPGTITDNYTANIIPASPGKRIVLIGYSVQSNQYSLLTFRDIANVYFAIDAEPYTQYKSTYLEGCRIMNVNAGLDFQVNFSKATDAYITTRYYYK